MFLHTKQSINFLWPLVELSWEFPKAAYEEEIAWIFCGVFLIALNQKLYSSRFAFSVVPLGRQVFLGILIWVRLHLLHQVFINYFFPLSWKCLFFIIEAWKDFKPTMADNRVIVFSSEWSIKRSELQPHLAPRILAVTWFISYFSNKTQLANQNIISFVKLRKRGCRCIWALQKLCS